MILWYIAIVTHAHSQTHIITTSRFYSTWAVRSLKQARRVGTARAVPTRHSNRISKFDLHAFEMGFMHSMFLFDICFVMLLWCDQCMFFFLIFALPEFLLPMYVFLIIIFPICVFLTGLCVSNYFFCELSDAFCLLST